MAFWFFPSNKKKFDMVRCLSSNNEVEQPNYYNKIRKGDIVFIYVTEPFGQIKYQMEVVDIVPLSGIDMGRWTRHTPYGSQPPTCNWMRMRVVRTARAGYAPLQFRNLEYNDIKVAGLVYPLTRAKAEYIMNAFDNVILPQG